MAGKGPCWVGLSQVPGNAASLPMTGSCSEGVFERELMAIFLWFSFLCSAKDMKYRLGVLLQKSESCEHSPSHSKKDKLVVCQR